MSGDAVYLPVKRQTGLLKANHQVRSGKTTILLVLRTDTLALKTGEANQNDRPIGTQSSVHVFSSGFEKYEYFELRRKHPFQAKCTAAGPYLTQWLRPVSQSNATFAHLLKTAVLAKPDAIYSKNGSVTVVEYKSRNGPVLESDVIQGLTACLAVKSAGYKVRDLMVITGRETKTVSVPEAAKSLYQMVANYVEGARAIKMESKNGRGSKSG